MGGFGYGDVVWMDFEPSAGHEQRKRRPAVVVSNDAYNLWNNLTMVVPVTTADNGYPLHVAIGEIPAEDGGSVRGWAEVEQLKSLDLVARGAVAASSLDEARLDEVTDLVLGCLMKPTMEIEDTIDGADRAGGAAGADWSGRGTLRARMENGKLIVPSGWRDDDDGVAGVNPETGLTSLPAERNGPEDEGRI